jgi:16S rRNA (uracil1498-N3)-methyltransferase
MFLPMGTHRIYVDAVPAVGSIVRIEGDEAKHALRVKRIEPGNAVQLLDGAGTIAEGVSEQLGETRRGAWVLTVRVTQAARVEPVRPALHVWSATPKGAHLEEMIDALSQVGAASWAPLQTAHGVVDPRDSKLERIQRVAVGASKQCGRAWVLRTGPKQLFADALASNDGPVILADASGGVYEPCGAERIRLLIGPEGGWTSAELEAARRAGARICSFGPHAMRIETAATVAAGVVLALERASDTTHGTAHSTH